MKKIKLRLLMLLLATHVSSEVFIYDNYTQEQREEKIAAKIRKCKNVVNVTVRDDNEESTCADVVIELTNDRIIHLKYVDLKLKGYNADIIRINDIFPIGWGYDSPQSTMTTYNYWLGLKTMNFLALKYLMGKDSWDICKMINHYDEVYAFFNKLPDWDKTLPHGKFDVSKDDMAEPVCPLWERYDNPFLVREKHYTSKTKFRYAGYKFFKANQRTFNDEWYKQRNNEWQYIDIN